MSKYVLKNGSGSYFVAGRGFSGKTECEGTVYTDKSSASGSQSCLAKLGFGDSELVEVSSVSFACVYIRKGDADGIKVTKKKGDANMNQIDPSKRRFATFDEARIHGSRFHVRKANRGDKPGTAGHLGYYVTETNDPVNAAVNPKTGLTNSI